MLYEHTELRNYGKSRHRKSRATDKTNAGVIATYCAVAGALTSRPATIAGAATGIGSAITKRFFLGPISIYLVAREKL